MPNPDQHYDYIIAGGGMAGLSLAYYLNQSEVLRKKKILILDKEQKTANDRTWCFWERGESNPLEQIVYRKWRKLDFFGTGFTKRYELKDYVYKMIRGIDFYRFVAEDLRKNPNITFAFQEIRHIENTAQGAEVVTDTTKFTASYVFDSTFRPDFAHENAHSLLQHFKGWVLTVPQPHFDPACATLQDFQVQQHGDEARFFYLLPFSPTQALVEYTLFSPQLLDPQQYDAELSSYVQQKLGLTDYTIDEEEFGVIPMSDAPVAESQGAHIVRIGTSGGYVRASTGYTFARTQRYLQTIVHNLEKTGRPEREASWFSKRFRFYDSVMLNVLVKKRHSGAAFFSGLYRDNNIERIFDFLDEHSRFPSEIRVMLTAPWWPFTVAAADVLRRRAARMLR